MRNTLSKNIRDGVTYLKGAQATNGKFVGLAGVDSAAHTAVKTDTIFFTALIADCLRLLGSARSVRSQATDYLLQHKSDQWTWNYWERQSQSRPYPDDWDDTACAAAAIINFNPHLIDARSQARIARALISSEVAAGGPYTTWLASKDLGDWQDVDLVVNVNIGYLLSRLDVRSPALEEYIGDCIKQGNFESRYYCGRAPALYFLSRWYRGAAQADLTKAVLSELAVASSVLEQAMLVAAAVNLGHKQAVDQLVITNILAAQRPNGSWPAQALYYEPPQNGAWRYAGSAELTTAFVVEALYAWQQTAQSDVTAEARRDVAKIAEVIAGAGDWQIDARLLQKLDKGSQEGWAAYGIYDDLIDGQASITKLGEANKAMRRSLNNFVRALPDSRDFADFVTQAFDAIDEANSWELVAARDLNKLPDYGNYSQLARRSWGHVIAPTGVLMAAGFGLTGREVVRLHRFFFHYLIARQLSDDAHDWQDDLAQGRISAVVAMLLMGCNSPDSRDREVYFWQHTIDAVNKLIRQNLAEADRALTACTFFVNKTELKQWLHNVEVTCIRAEQGRHDAQQFIDEFTHRSLIH